MGIISSTRGWHNAAEGNQDGHNRRALPEHLHFYCITDIGKNITRNILKLLSKKTFPFPRNVLSLQHRKETK